MAGDGYDSATETTTITTTTEKKKKHSMCVPFVFLSTNLLSTLCPSVSPVSVLLLVRCSFFCWSFLSYNHHHHHQFLNREGRWGTTNDFATSFLHFSLFSTVLWDLTNSRPVQSLMLSSHLFLCPPCLLPPFTVPCKMVLARPDERET